MSKPGNHQSEAGAGRAELTPEQQREIAALEAMPDSEIDTSDIPELGPEFFKNSKVGLSSLLLAIGKECAPLFKEPYCSTDHGDLLYNDKGLPK
jgi:antitoxin VapB